METIVLFWRKDRAFWVNPLSINVSLSLTNEDWRVGALESWIVGTLERWNVGRLDEPSAEGAKMNQ